MQMMLLQVLCVAVVVGLTHAITPAIDEIILTTPSRMAFWPLWWHRDEHGVPSGTEPFELYQMGDPYGNWAFAKPFWYGAKIHLVTAAVLGAIAPLLPLGHNPFGLAGLIGLIPLFGHMVAIDFGESRLPNPLTTLASIIGLVTVLLAGILEPEHLRVSILGGGLVLLAYFVLWFINKKGLGLGDVEAVVLHRTDPRLERLERAAVRLARSVVGPRSSQRSPAGDGPRSHQEGPAADGSGDHRRYVRGTAAVRAQRCLSIASRARDGLGGGEA